MDENQILSTPSHALSLIQFQNGLYTLFHIQKLLAWAFFEVYTKGLKSVESIDFGLAGHRTGIVTQHSSCLTSDQATTAKPGEKPISWGEVICDQRYKRTWAAHQTEFHSQLMINVCCQFGECTVYVDLLCCVVAWSCSILCLALISASSVSSTPSSRWCFASLSSKRPSWSAIILLSSWVNFRPDSWSWLSNSRTRACKWGTSKFEVCHNCSQSSSHSRQEYCS